MLALKNPGEGFCCLARSQKPWWGLVLIVCALKNPGRGFVLNLFSLKHPGGGFLPDGFRSQKPRVGGLGYPCPSKKPRWGVLVVFSSPYTPSKTLETMRHVERFLAPTHQILVDLKIRFISQIEKQVSSQILTLYLSWLI